MRQLIASILIILFTASVGMAEGLVLGWPPTGGGGTCTGTYGWSTVAETYQAPPANQAAAIKRTLGCNATSGTFNAWLGNVSGTSLAYFYAYIATDNAGEPGTVVWVSSQQEIAIGDSTQSKRTVAFSGISLSAGDYWFVVQNVQYTTWKYTADSGTAATVTSANMYDDTDLSLLTWTSTPAERSINVEF